MANVGTATIEIIPSMTGFSAKVSQQVEPAMSTSGSKGGISFGTSFLTGFASRIVQGTVISAVVQPIIDTVLGLGQQALFGFNAQMQQAKTGFTTMLGSADAAKTMLGQLIAFANATPFETTNVVTYAERLMAMGISAKDVIPDLTAIGDAAAALGTGTAGVDSISKAIGQMQSTGHVMAQDMLQLTQAGIPAWAILANQLGVTESQLRKMVTAGDVASSVAIPALISGLENGTKSTAAFGGMMDKQSHTMVGALSNLKDTIISTIGADTSGLFDSLTQKVAGLAGWVSGGGFQAGLDKLKTWATGTFGDDMKKIADGFSNLWDVIKVAGPGIGKAFGADVVLAVHAFATAFDLLSKALVPLAPILPGLLQAFIGFKVLKGTVDTLQTMETAFKGIKSAIYDMQIAFTGVKNVSTFVTALKDLRVAWEGVAAAELLASLADPFVWIPLAVAAVVGALVYLQLKFDIFGKAWTGIKIAAQAVADWFTGPFVNFFKGVGDFFTGPFLTPFHAIGDFFSGPFLTPFHAIGDFFTVTIPGWGDSLVSFFEQLPGRVLAFIQAIPGALLQLLKDLAFGFGVMVGLIVLELIKLPGQIWDILTFLWDGAVLIVTTGVGLLVAGFMWLVTHAVAEAKALPGQIWDLLTGLWNKAKSIVSTGVDDVVTFFQKLPGRVVSVWNTFKDDASKAVEAVVGFFTALPGRIGSALSGFGMNVWGGLKSVLNQGIDILNSGIRGFNSVPGVPNIAQIPHLASGGIIDKPTVALVGEAGPEAVVPLSKLDQIVQSAVNRAGGGASKVLNYYAAPGSSISAEEDLFAAAGRARMVW